MITFIIYIWILDLFLYSNTELFLIFFIYFTFGILVVNFVIWFSEYADEFVLIENRDVYTSTLKFRAQLVDLRTSMHGLSIHATGKKFTYWYSSIFFARSVLIIVSILNLVWCRYNSFKQYIKLNAYIFNLLVQFYKFELLNFSKFVSGEFLSLNESIALNSQTNLVVNCSNYLTVHLFSDILFNFFITFYTVESFSCEKTYFFYWSTYLPFVVFIKISLKIEIKN